MSTNDIGAYYNFPNQLISEKEKNEEWLIKNVDAICNAYNCNQWKKIRDILCAEILEGVISEKRYEYITKEYGKQYPAKLKNYPLIRPILDTALGMEIEQNFNYNVRRIDEDGLNEKRLNIVYDIVQNIFEKIANREIKGSIDKKLLDELERQKNNEYVSEIEIIAHKLACYYEQTLDLKTKKNKLFASILETGRCFWKTEIPRLGADPIIRVIPTHCIEHSLEDVENIADCTWVVEKTYMTKEEILDLYIDELTKEDIEYIKNTTSHMYTNIENSMFIFEDKDAINKLRDEGYENFFRNYYDRNTNKIAVYRGQWKSLRKMTMLEMKNDKNPYAPFYKLWEADTIPKHKEKNILSKDTRYIQELYEFVRIGDAHYYGSKRRGNGIYIRMGKSPIQIRSIDNPYYVKLHYQGFTFSKDTSNMPFSLVWYLKDLQELYNILNYHRERMIALSGVKGIVYDLSQRPNGMELHDILYYRKLGLALIESSKGQGQFNQFQNYNDSLDASVSILTQMLEDIRIECDRISGFNRQMQGQMFQKDLVGQIDKAIRQGSYATAVLYYHQDKVYKNLLEGLINFSKYAYKDNNSYKTLSYVLGDGAQEIFKLNDNFVLSDFGIFFTSSGKENAKIEMVKNIAQTMASQGQIKLNDLISIIKADNLAEIESKLLYKLEQTEKMMQEMQKAQAQQPDKEIELKMQELKTKYEIEKMKLQELRSIKEMELQLKIQENEKRNAYKERELALMKEKKDILEKKVEDDKKYKESILSLKQDLLSLEREEFRNAVENNSVAKNRKEIKNI